MAERSYQAVQVVPEERKIGSPLSLHAAINAAKDEADVLKPSGSNLWERPSDWRRTQPDMVEVGWHCERVQERDEEFHYDSEDFTFPFQVRRIS